MPPSLFRLTAAAATAFGGSARAFSTSLSRSYAKITIIGHLGDAPELRTGKSGVEYIHYKLASNYGPHDNRKTSWFQVTSFPPTEKIRDLVLGLSKGSMIYVEGDAALEVYEDGEGKQKTAFNVVQRQLEILKRSVVDPSPAE